MKNEWMKMVVMAIGMVCLLLGYMVPLALAYDINGAVDDWGITLSTSGADVKGYLDSNTPTGGRDIDFITEDNADQYTDWTRVWPLYSYKNYFDAEALYFDNDDLFAYVAVITGLPSDGYDPPGNTAYDDPYYKFKPGDIFFDTDPNQDGYEYALDISSGNFGKVGSVQGVYYADGASAAPWIVTSWDGTPISVPFVYSSDDANTHYVLEAKIPLSYFGETVGVHWTMECGNDALDLTADVNPVPEPATMLLLGSGLVGLAGFGRRRLRKMA